MLTRLAGSALVALVVLASSSKSSSVHRVQGPSSPNLAATDTEPTFIEMRNVHFHVGGDVVLRIRNLHGLMRGRDGVVDFDDGTSFTTWVNTAEVGMAADDLSRLFNNHVFAYPGAPLRKIRVQLVDGQLRQSGILHKGVDIPFKIKSVVSVTPDGRIRLHPVDTDIFGVDGDKLMRALGLTMQKMVDVSKAVGVTIEKNDFLIDPIRILPPPKIRGRLTAVRVENGELVQQIGPEPGTAAQFASTRLAPPDTSAKNYMYYRGGKLHFGRKLLMADADMQVIDGDPTNPFDFNLDRYMAQLVAGYSRTLPNAGLWVLMPDANRVTRLEHSVGGEVTSGRETGKVPLKGATKP
ncbi:MAG: hypothetical protein WD825_14715 [Gemmatimonadaceae bacterium]